MTAVVCLDLDSFSFINTGLGSACGDEFLRETARRLARLVRDSDTVARIGSDEFVILLAGLESVERSSARLNAMLTAVRAPVAVMSFARALGMRTIAEGVETEGQAAFLHDHGCDDIQGYLVARPLPAEQLLERFRQPAQGSGIMPPHAEPPAP